VQARGHELQTANIRINRQANIILQMESGSETRQKTKKTFPFEMESASASGSETGNETH
jgi:hypothetical protein